MCFPLNSVEEKMIYSLDSLVFLFIYLYFFNAVFIESHTKNGPVLGI